MIDEFSRFPFAFACPDMTSSTVIKCLCQVFSIFGMPSYIHTDRGSSFMSEELRNFLHSRGIATSRTTAYSPQANGQVERLNGTIWRGITLSLRSRDLATQYWETVLPDALHSIRSLLCTATNATPHERLFRYNRKATFGTALPSWLVASKKVLLKRSNRPSKYDSMVDEVELIECNPSYARIRFAGGEEDTVSVRHLAPVPAEETKSYQINPSHLTNTEETVSLESDVPAQNQTTVEQIPNTTPTQTESLHPLVEKQQRVHPYCLRNREA